VPLAGGAIETLTTACTSSPTCYVPPPFPPQTGIVLDAASVYFTANDGSLRKIPKTGGASSAVTSSPFVLGAVDATYAYGVDKSGSVPSIAKVPTGGGTLVVLYTPPDPMTTPQPPGVDATNVYWVEDETSASPPVKAAVKSVPIAGGTATTLASTLDLSSTWATPFVQGGQVLWWQYRGGASTITLLGVPTGGGTPFSYGPPNVVSAGDDVAGPAFDGTDVYVAVSRMSPDPAAGTGFLEQVFASPIGGPMTTFASGSLGGTTIGGIAVDACNVYWVTEKSLVRRAK